VRANFQKSTVVRTIQRFIKTGSVKDHSRSGRLTSASNDEESAFCKVLSKRLIRLLEKLLHKVSQSSVCNILKRFHPCKMFYVQDLIHEDFDQRIEFCELIEAHGNDFVSNIAFSEVSNFMGMLIVRNSDIGTETSIE